MGTRCMAPILACAAILACGAGTFGRIGLRSGLAGEATVATGAPAPAPFASEQLRERLAWLAHDDRRGRDTTSTEAVEVSAWIAAAWERAGLLPRGVEGTWFQPFAVPEPVLGEGNRLETIVDGAVESHAVEKDWNPFSVSGCGEVEGDVVFAGFGIRAPERNYDDLAGIDVAGKVVLVFRKNPGWQEAQHAAFLTKLKVLSEAGATAVLLCNNPETTAGGSDGIGHWSASLGAPAASASIPYLFVSQAIAQRLLATAGLELAQVENALRTTGPASRDLPGVRVRLATSLAKTEGKNARNVVGWLPGYDPDVAEEVVVLGAHFDHVGLGLFGSTGGAEAVGQIHNGADDNGSGTTLLLALADWFSRPENRPRRSMQFIAFTGEERGLLGSAYYVAHPTIPLEDVVAMLNLDMVGRCREGRLHVGGVGTAEGLQELVAACNAAAPLSITWDPGGAAPSDSTSFFRKGLPVLFFFTMLHADYHRPSDDIEHIEFDSMERIGRLVAAVAAEIADRDERLVFTRPPEPPRPPRIGLQLSPEADALGVRVESVVPRGPAAEGGVLPGDVLTSLAGQVVRTREDLLRALGRLEPGKRVEVGLLREGEPLTLAVVLGARQGR